MARVDRFEDLIAWQKGRKLVSTVYSITRDGSFAHDFALSNQIRKAAISVPSNISEGFERSGTKEFLHFLSIAKGSCAEVRTQHYVAMDLGYLSEAEMLPIMSEAEEVGRIIGGLRASLVKRQSSAQP